MRQGGKSKRKINLDEVVLVVLGGPDSNAERQKKFSFQTDEEDELIKVEGS